MPRTARRGEGRRPGPEVVRAECHSDDYAWQVPFFDAAPWLGPRSGNQPWTTFSPFLRKSPRTVI
jgi:hypothetical protein